MKFQFITNTTTNYSYLLLWQFMPAQQNGAIFTVKKKKKETQLMNAKESEKLTKYPDTAKKLSKTMEWLESSPS